MINFPNTPSGADPAVPQAEARSPAASSTRLSQEAVSWLSKFRQQGAWCARGREPELIAGLRSLPIPGLRSLQLRTGAQGFHAARWEGGESANGDPDWRWHGESGDAFFDALANAFENARLGSDLTALVGDLRRHSLVLRTKMTDRLKEQPGLCNDMAMSIPLKVGGYQQPSTSMIGPCPDVPAERGQTCILLPGSAQAYGSGWADPNQRLIQAEGVYHRLTRVENEWPEPDMRERMMKQVASLAVEFLGMRDTAIVCHREEEGQRCLPPDHAAAPHVLFIGHRGRDHASQALVTLKTAGTARDFARNRIAGPATTAGFLSLLHHAIEVGRGAPLLDEYAASTASAFRTEFISRLRRLLDSDPETLLRLTNEDAWRPWA